MLRFINAVQIVLLFVCSPFIIGWLFKIPEIFRGSWIVGCLASIAYFIFFSVMTKLVYENLYEK